MSRKVKELIEKELSSRYEGTESALVVDVSALSGNAANEFRRKMFDKGIEIHVIKNRSARRVFSDGPLSHLGSALKGPCALVTTDGSIIDVAKQLVELTKEYPNLVLRGGVVDGAPDYLPVEDISKMRSRLEIIGDIAACAVAPGRKLAGSLKSSGGKLAGCLKGMVEKLEKGEAIAKVA